MKTEKFKFFIQLHELRIHEYIHIFELLFFLLFIYFYYLV